MFCSRVRAVGTVLVLLIGIAGGAGWQRMGRYLDLACMGVLISVYLGVETTRHVRLPPPAVLYVVLLGSREVRELA